MTEIENTEKEGTKALAEIHDWIAYLANTAFMAGGAVAFGIIGMAEAIRAKHASEHHRAKLEAVCGPLDEPCSACGAPVDELCRPSCTANEILLSREPLDALLEDGAMRDDDIREGR